MQCFWFKTALALMAIIPSAFPISVSINDEGMFMPYKDQFMN